jgi:hypothetical protein
VIEAGEHTHTKLRQPFCGGDGGNINADMYQRQQELLQKAFSAKDN